MNASHRTWRDDAGQVGGIEALPFGVLVFVAGALLITNVWAVIDVKLSVTTAARAATHAYVEAPSHRAGMTAASAAARRAVADYRRDPDAMHIVEQPEHAGFERCNRVEFTVAYDVPAVSLPFIGSFGDGIRVTASDSELVDPFRSGIAGAVTCED